MKTLLFIIFTFITIITIHSQSKEIVNEKFLCSIGSFNDFKFPLKIVEFEYRDDTKKLSNGKTFPFLYEISSKINSNNNWNLTYKGDTTSIVSSELYSSEGTNAILEIKGEDFSKKMNSKNCKILYFSENKIIFSEYGVNWIIIK